MSRDALEGASRKYCSLYRRGDGHATGRDIRMYSVRTYVLAHRVALYGTYRVYFLYEKKRFFLRGYGRLRPIRSVT